MDRTRVVIAAGLAVLLVAGVIIVSLVFGSGNDQVAQPQPPSAPLRTGPVPLVPVPAPAAASADCTTLIQKVPATLQADKGVLTKAALAEPAPPASVAWTDQRSEPVVLRCGLEKPAELTPTTQNLRAVDGVSWLPVEGPGSTTWYLADRPVYVALTIPGDTGTGPLQDISTLVGKTLAKKTS
ncbi:DUF3515 domain-containing protein [Kibdelosporangium phytohabitans]|uniref:DUF3515 domain-containing protein n=1 Tax=Kibdelosporangium phytohabitans TaxID=860235 RepID=A0A0N9IEC3_9PSEU|nr:DUF3515 domain-containing protein [Kibdelosporangium phytohabitans]ALG13106.1 hypothetical protein AOZ06_45185 [Kibdelosporangium phytohabitans]MBE1464847.1 hypothetical protein [Kibdelosporangium phytohabitans]